MQATRDSKRARFDKKVQQANDSLASHPKAKVETARRKLSALALKLKIADWINLEVKERTLTATTSADLLQEEQKLDGCYVLKTDLPAEMADKQTVHDRYKDLALVAQAFRASKTRHLEMRPVYVQREASTWGHALVVMLAYQIVRYLQRAWVNFDLTVEEGLRDLSTICLIEAVVKDQASCHRIPIHA